MRQQHIQSPSAFTHWFQNIYIRGESEDRSDVEWQLKEQNHYNWPKKEIHTRSIFVTKFLWFRLFPLKNLADTLGHLEAVKAERKYLKTEQWGMIHVKIDVM